MLSATIAMFFGLSGVISASIVLVGIDRLTGVLLPRPAFFLLVFVLTGCGAALGYQLATRWLLGAWPSWRFPPLAEHVALLLLVMFAGSSVHGDRPSVPFLVVLLAAAHGVTLLGSLRRDPWLPRVVADQVRTATLTVPYGLLVGALAWSGVSMLGWQAIVLLALLPLLLPAMLLEGAVRLRLLYHAHFHGRFHAARRWTWSLMGRDHTLEALLMVDAADDDALAAVVARTDPDSVQIRLVQAHRSAQAGHHQQAAAQLDALWEDWPDASVATARVRVGGTLGELPDAERWAERAKRTVPRWLSWWIGLDPRAGDHVTRAWLALLTGDAARARTELDQADAVPNPPLVRAGIDAERARILHALGDPAWKTAASRATEFGAAPAVRVADLSRSN
jgi:hypothetical protein